MAYDVTQDPNRWGWQTKQFVIDPNARTRTTVLDCLAYPATSGLVAEIENVAHEKTEYLTNHPGASSDSGNAGY